MCFNEYAETTILRSAIFSLLALLLKFVLVSLLLKFRSKLNKFNIKVNTSKKVRVFFDCKIYV